MNRITFKGGSDDGEFTLMGSCQEAVKYNNYRYIILDFEISKEWLNFCNKIGIKVRRRKEYELHRTDYFNSRFKVFFALTILRYSNTIIADKTLEILKQSPKLDPIVAFYIGSFLGRGYGQGHKGIFSYSHSRLPLVIKSEKVIKHLTNSKGMGNTINSIFMENRICTRYNEVLPAFREIDKFYKTSDYEEILKIFKKYKMYAEQ